MANASRPDAGYRNILCAIDPATEAGPILAMAKALRTSSCVVDVISVLPEKDALAIDTVERKLKDQVRSTFVSDSVHVHMATGSARDRILQVAHDVAADLIIVGTKAAGRSTFLFGSTANYVVHAAKSDVLVVRQNGRDEHAVKPYASAAAGFDSNTSDVVKLVKHAGRVACADNLSLFHVMGIDDCVVDERLEPNCVESEYFRAETQMRDYGQSFDIPLKRQHLFVGKFQHALSSLVRDTQVELLVVGGRQLGNAFSLPLDTLSTVLHCTPCDVLIVR